MDYGKTLLPPPNYPPTDLGDATMVDQRAPFDELTPSSPFSLMDDEETPLVLTRPKTPRLPTSEDANADLVVEPYRPKKTPRLPSSPDVVSSAPSPLTANVPGGSPPDAGAQPSRAAAVAGDWISHRAHRRPLPRGARIALALGAGVVCLFVASRTCTAPQKRAAASDQLHADLLVSADELRDRREATADDFRVPGARASASSRPARKPTPSPTPSQSQAATPTPKAKPTTKPVSRPTTERRGKRTKVRRRAEHSNPSQTGADGVGSDVPQLLSFGPRKRPTGSRPTRKILVSPGSQYRARLSNTVMLRQGSQSVIARIQGGPLAKARLVGRARATGSRVAMRFHTLVRNGKSVRIRAEAKDADGSSSLSAAQLNKDSGPSVAGEVRRGTTRRVLRGVSGGLVGGGIGDAVNAWDRQGRMKPRGRVVLHVPKGRIFKMLFLKEVVNKF